MLKYADLLEQSTEKIARIETLNMGMPIIISRMLVNYQVETFRYYAGLVDKIPGETYPEDGDGQFKMITYEPLGVCAGISAWNGTGLSLAWKVCPLSKIRVCVSDSHRLLLRWLWETHMYTSPRKEARSV
jgi:aldehyde dehydrogenase (NAD+)